MTAPDVRVLVVQGIADLLPDSYSGNNQEIDIEEFFTKCRQWLNVNHERFADDASRVAAIKYVLSGTALQCFNGIPAANMQGNVNMLKQALFAKFRINKTRQEWKKELDKCKYVPSSNCLPMINRFQVVCDNLQWLVNVQIEKFIRILLINLRQFVISRAHLTFNELAESVITYQ